MKTYALFGEKISSSLSPSMWNHYFSKIKSDSKYILINPQSVQNIPLAFYEFSLSGANITAPYKESIIPFLDDLDGAAKKIGAVNTIVLDDGRLKGFNTDYIGVQQSLIEKSIDPTKEEIVILGAGGAARAVLFALEQMGTELVSVFNRTSQKVKQLQSNYKIIHHLETVEELESKLKKATLCINTVSEENDLILNLKQSFTKTWFDAAYNISSAKLAEEYIDGKTWILSQAKAAAEIFSLQESGKLELIDITKRNNRKLLNLAFIGFMGVGKSDISKNLAIEMEKQYVDVDQVISQKNKMSIEEIFSNLGEEAFRDKEADAIKELEHIEDSIISCGGGVIGDQKNIDSLRKHSFIIWIWRDLESAINSIDVSTRPMLKGETNLSIRAEDLYSQRKEKYLNAADYILINHNCNLKCCVRSLKFDFS